MNIIVTNKYKDLIYDTGIEILKEMNGVFKVSEIVKNFSSLFYKKIIIDATALENFPKDSVLKELAKSFDLDKLILFLPPDNPAPRNFLSFLISLNIYNFTDNAKGLIELIKRSNTINDVSNFIEIKEEKSPVQDDNNNINNNDFNITGGRIIIGIKSITSDSYSSRLIYMFKKTLESVYNKNVIALEVDKKELVYYNDKNMLSINKNQINMFMNNNLNCDILLVDLDNCPIKCDDEIYLINPSIFYVNKLVYNDREVFASLSGKKIIFVDSLLNENDVNKFASEANISIYYNMKPLNDRIHDNEIDKLLIKLGIVSQQNNKSNKKGLFDFFK